MFEAVRGLTAAAVAMLAVSQLASAQVCRISAAGLNRNRRVQGAVHAECPSLIHTAPFGNWGVTSNFGQKRDDHQFQGWCHDTRICDNFGACRTDCTDGWYEWNSCTDVPQYAAPNCTLYNDANCTAQVSTTGINVHGTRVTDVSVRCPSDADGDGIPETGGCNDAATFRSGTNFMSLYELDPGTGDELVQSLYFPEVAMTLRCDPWGCPPVGSEWMPVSFWDSPSTPAKVFAELAVLINSATFVDTGGKCQASHPPISAVVSAASFAAPVAPDSITTLLGSGLATGTASATSATLPQDLAGTRVAVVDSAGVSRPASLSYVSPGQINLVIPAGSSVGLARVNVTRSDRITTTGSVQIAAVAPAVFTANANGTGVPAATAVRVSSSGAQTSVSVFRCDGGAGNCVPAPIDLGGAGDRVFLALYGTGIRRAGNAVSVSIGGVPAQVTYAGAQSQYPGLDQVNVLIPPELRGRGAVEITLSESGTSANRVSIVIQ